MRKALVALFVLALASPLFAAGCGSPPSVLEFCRRQCDCAHCSEQQDEDCNDLTFQEQDDAIKAGCDGQFEDLLGCGTTVSCTNGQLDINRECGGELVALAQCVGRGGKRN